MYSLLSASVLAADLARHPYGVRVADTVERVLALTPQEQQALRGPAPAALRLRVLEACQDPPQVGAATGLVVGARPDSGDLPAVHGHGLAALQGALIGTITDLHALLEREEPLCALPETARQVALDGVTAAWAGPTAALRDIAGLAAPWEAALAPVPPPLPQTAYVHSLRALLDEVARRGAAGWARSAQAHSARRGLAWSAAMHEACAAAAAAGRVAEVARAQLSAARALVLAQAPISPYAAGMIVTAVVQATCTADLLEPDVRRTLTVAWEAGG